MSLGVAVDLSGDVDGDGYADVVAGADTWSVGQPSEGAVLVYLGSPGGPSATEDWVGESDRDTAHLGLSVCAAGDLDGDVFDDVVAGSQRLGGAAGGQGGLDAWFGSSAGPAAGAADWTVESGQVDAFLGLSVGAGDLDADGYDDLVAGASSWDATVQDEGALFVFLGSAAGPAGAPDQVVGSGVPVGFLGLALAVADLDGNGFVDVVSGMAKPPSGGKGTLQEGAAVAYRGSSLGLALAPLDDLGGYVARMLRAEAGLVRVEVAGHTDDRGGVAYNQELSERRAVAVRDALVARGIDPERLVARGYGRLLRPLEPGADEAARARNRRVEIVVLERAPWPRPSVARSRSLCSRSPRAQAPAGRRARRVLSLRSECARARRVGAWIAIPVRDRRRPRTGQGYAFAIMEPSRALA